MTQTKYETKEQKIRRLKKEAEQEQLLLMAYIGGNMGSVYMMEAVAQAAE